MNPAMSEERGHCQQAVDLAAEQELAFIPDIGLDQELASFGSNMDLSPADQTDPLMAAACSGIPLPCMTTAAAGGTASKCISRQTLKQLKEQTDQLYCKRYIGEEGKRKGGVKGRPHCMYVMSILFPWIFPHITS